MFKNADFSHDGWYTNRGQVNGPNVLNLSYDSEDRLSNVQSGSLTESYGYDPSGRRIRKTSNGQTTYYRYQGADILAQYQSTWNKPAAYYLQGAGTDAPVVRYSQQSNGSYRKTYLHQDGLGSVILSTDESGTIQASQIFDAWGNQQTAQSIGTIATYGYTGREPDNTGLIYYRARYYDPQIARFTQRDPLGLKGGMNLYSYVNNDPINFTDPSGECPWCVGAIYGGIAGGIGGAFTGYASGGGWGAAKGFFVGGAVGAAVGTVAPWLSARAGAGAVAVGAASTVGRTVAIAGVGGVSSAAGQVAGNVVDNLSNGKSMGDNVTRNMSKGAIIGSAVGAPVAAALGRIAGNLAGSNVGTTISWGSKSLTVMTPTVEYTAGVTGALVEGSLGGLSELVGQEIEESNNSSSSTSTNTRQVGNQSMQIFTQSTQSYHQISTDAVSQIFGGTSFDTSYTGSGLPKMK